MILQAFSEQETLAVARFVPKGTHCRSLMQVHLGKSDIDMSDARQVARFFEAGMFLDGLHTMTRIRVSINRFFFCLESEFTQAH